jgi:hypothetical protein
MTYRYVSLGPDSSDLCNFYDCDYDFVISITTLVKMLAYIFSRYCLEKLNLNTRPFIFVSTDYFDGMFKRCSKLRISCLHCRRQRRWTLWTRCGRFTTLSCPSSPTATPTGSDTATWNAKRRTGREVWPFSTGKWVSLHRTLACDGFKDHVMLSRS